MSSGRHPGQEDQSFLFSLDVLVQGRTNGQALERLMARLNGCGHIVDYRITGGVRLGRVIEEALRLAQADGAGDAAMAASAGQPAPESPSAAEAGKAPAVCAQAGTQDGAGSRPDRPRVAEPRSRTGGEEENPDGGQPAGERKPASPLIGQIFQYIAGRNLVRLTVVKGRGVKLNMPCRILNYDETMDNMTVYHVDEKKVYTVKLTEIDEMTAS